MLLEQYARQHAAEGVSLFPFRQTEGHCMALSSAWLKWFFAAREEDLLAGRFDPYSQKERIVALQQNEQSIHYEFKLHNIMNALNLTANSTSSSRHSTIQDAVNLESNAYKKGGIVLASEPFQGGSVGHAISFGFRRFRADKDEAIFGFFDADEGMLFMRLSNFPATQHEQRDEDDPMNDTTHVVSTYEPYMAGVNRINHFFKTIQPGFNYGAFKAHKVKSSKPSPQQSPVMFSRHRGTSTSPRLQSRENTSTSPRSPNLLSRTMQTPNSIRK